LQNGSQDNNDILKHFIDDFHSEKPTAFFNRKIFYADAAVILVGATYVPLLTTSHRTPWMRLTPPQETR